MGATEGDMPRLGPACLALLATAAAPARAFSAEPRPLALAVSDAQGHFVVDLRAEEVRVLENGQPRELARFERDARPLAVYLVLDTSAGAGRVFRTQAFDSVWAFVSGLPAGARGTLWTTGDRPRKLGALEGDRKAVDKKVGQGFAMGGANALLDTLAEAASSLAGESGRRRALVVLTGSGAGYTSLTPRDVTAQARSARAPVFALMYDEGEAAGAGSLRPSNAPRDVDKLTIVGASDHERILSGLAQGTGGRFERIPSALGAVTAFASLTNELGGQYRIRFVSGETQGPKRVEVRIARPGVRSRVTVDSP
jgi:VWFA-related protein